MASQVVFEYLDEPVETRLDDDDQTVRYIGSVIKHDPTPNAVGMVEIQVYRGASSDEIDLLWHAGKAMHEGNLDDPRFIEDEALPGTYHLDLPVVEQNAN